MALDKLLPDLFKKIKVAFGRLGKRERVLIVLLILATSLSFYFNKILKPQFKRLSLLKLKLADLDRQIVGLKEEMPALQKEKAVLEELKLKNKQLKERLNNLEKELPNSYRISQLLGELAKQAGGLMIDFSYIKPKAALQASEEEEYARLDIEMQLNAPYKDFSSYLKALEHLSAYLNITDIVIEKMEESVFATEATATLVLSTLLNKRSQVLGPVEPGPKVEILLAGGVSERNPFVPSTREITSSSKKPKYVLSGITFAGPQSTAIINNAVYKTGDLLDKKYPIKQILPNMVILIYGRQTETLMLE